MNGSLNISSLSPAPGSKRSKKRKGRGAGSGIGRASCRGTGGSNKRSGFSKKAAFEGGQMPLVRRLPKRGFKNTKFRKDYETVSIAALQDKFKSGDRVTPGKLITAGLAGGKMPVKILGNGEIKKKLSVTGCFYTKSAKEKIINAGGTAE